MALTYIGNCDWQPAGEAELHAPPHEIPTLREPWLGRSDDLPTFLDEHAVGSEYLGGWIIDVTPRDNTPFFGVASADVVVALPPDATVYLSSDSEETKTATKSAVVTTSLVIDGATEVTATRDVLYSSAKTTYSYFALSRPGSNRFSSVLTVRSPRIIRSVIRATAKDGPLAGQERTWPFANAPAPLVSALSMSATNIGTRPEAEPIPGTPWFRCTETWTRELQGD